MDKRDMSKAICRCKKVFFEDIEAAIDNGASTFEEIKEHTKVSTGCRRCTQQAQEISEHLLSKKR